jgi:hypothetical protein
MDSYNVLDEQTSATQLVVSSQCIKLLYLVVLDTPDKPQ